MKKMKINKRAACSNPMHISLHGWISISLYGLIAHALTPLFPPLILIGLGRKLLLLLSVRLMVHVPLRDGTLVRFRV